ncbi:lactate utilization protein B/C [Corynebacterium sp. HMSC056E09]|uniref:LutC/YkgG family protein n=1 Tax=Corynebacterium TaxID=1716 RepID=UPI0008A5120C|nr:LUD domain-containing protein [Corynebacterium sp. HMSC056E09]MCG7259779.1 LUD domain-containing protein [Corynebacterium aurimucosum]MDK6807364.1 LUD domain-containing protein [Corynebacterium aurimucosum]NJJ83698.1 LUD domain-containing protein [Corynebacterium aurimucosum]OFQ92448.1 lactate utilization protein B/C [Corynebacterium sp. HMSC056E09]HCT9180025.1 LUD domain-containing protein [Corynebacterium aurimucosum]
MTTAKEEILNRIAAAQKQAGLPEHVEIPREYQKEGTLNEDELREMLVDRLEDYKADVHVTDESGLNSTLVDILKERGCSNVVYAPGMDAGLLAGFEGTITPDDNAKDPRELDAVDAVVTESHVTSAQTGTIVLESNETCGRRALTLVPDRHVCIVRKDQIVYGVPEMVSRINPERPATWISGPSATSDIELSRVEGVHGPRDLIVVIVK